MVFPAPSVWWPYQPSILAGQPEHMLSFMPLHSLPHTGSVLTFIVSPEGYLGLLPQVLEMGSKSTRIF